MEPTEVDETFADEGYESNAVRSGDELCFKFDHLPVYQYFWLLEQQF